MRFIDGVVLCYLFIVAMLLLLILLDGVGKWLVKMREQDLKRKMEASHDRTF